LFSYFAGFLAQRRCRGGSIAGAEADQKHLIANAAGYLLSDLAGFASVSAGYGFVADGFDGLGLHRALLFVGAGIELLDFDE
jgi:hypothetical protein